MLLKQVLSLNILLLYSKIFLLYNSKASRAYRSANQNVGLANWNRLNKY